jgi:hypothetical protein
VSWMQQFRQWTVISLAPSNVKDLDMVERILKHSLILIVVSGTSNAHRSHSRVDSILDRGNIATNIDQNAIVAYRKI